MKLSKVVGSTSEIWQIFIRDSSSSTGAGLTGLTNASGSLTAYYHRDTDTTATAIALVSMTVGTFTSSGFKEIDSVNMPGWYQLCPPNAALASGAKSCGFHLQGATNMVPVTIEVQLTAVNPDSATSFITGVNALAPPTNWNLTSIDSNGRLDIIKVAGNSQTARDLGAQLDATVSSRMATFTPLTAAQIATGVWQDATAGDFTAASSIGKSLYTSGAVPGASGGLFIAGSNAATTVTITGTISLTSAYDPAKTAAQAGDAMALTSGERTTLAGVMWNSLTSGMSTVGSIGKKLADWVVGTIDTYTGNTKQTGDSFARLGAPVGTSISDDISNITATVDPNDIFDAANGVESGLTMRQAFRLMVAALAGKLSGAGTTTIIIRDTNDTKNRVTALVDSVGNRNSVTIDPS